MYNNNEMQLLQGKIIAGIALEPFHDALSDLRGALCVCMTFQSTLCLLEVSALCQSVSLRAATSSLLSSETNPGKCVKLKNASKITHSEVFDIFRWIL